MNRNKVAYYNIRIGKPFPELKKSENKDDKKKLDMFDLPLWVRKLITSVDVTQTLDTEQGKSTATINFVAGSREPISEVYTSLYNEGGNQTGVLSDLVFTECENGTKKPGLPTKDDREKAAKKKEKEQNIFEAEKALENLETELKASDYTKKEIKEKYQEAEKKVKELQEEFKKLEFPDFVFTEGNTVEIEFGWLYPKQKLRKVLYQITEIATRFTTKGDSLSIVCKDMTEELNKYTPDKSWYFGYRHVYKKTQKGKKTKTIIKEIPMNPTEIVFKIADTFSFEPVVSPILATYQYKKKSKKWKTGQTLDEFMSQLAKELNAYYFIEYNWTINKHCLYFLSKLDYEAHIYRTYLYRDINSPIVDINISHKEERGKETTSTAVDKKKKNNTKGRDEQLIVDFSNMYTQGSRNEGVFIIPAPKIKSMIEEEQYYQDEIKELKEQIKKGSLPKEKINKIRKKLAKFKSLRASLSHAISSPDPEPGYKRAANIQDRAERNAVELSMVLEGDPFLVPSAIVLGQVGLRYSGRYYINTVTHSLGNKAFLTTVKGDTNKVGEEGKSESKKRTDNAQTKPLQVRIHTTGDLKNAKVETIVASVDINSISPKTKKRLLALGTLFSDKGVVDPKLNKHFMLGNTITITKERAQKAK